MARYLIAPIALAFAPWLVDTFAAIGLFVVVVILLSLALGYLMSGDDRELYDK